MKLIKQEVVKGERALFSGQQLCIEDTIFEDGESPLKESQDVEIDRSIFQWKYPLWYSKNANVKNSFLLDTGRAGIWYTDNIQLENTTIQAPKTFRRSTNISLKHVDMTNASETLWMCDKIVLQDVSANGDYFAMNSTNIIGNKLRLVGNYSFDGGKNIEITDANILSRDAFWNCENVIVRDAFIAGEYIGWNSRNLTFVNCTIQSLQGFCYIDGLTLENCRLLETNLAFEYCRNIKIDVTTGIDSIKNPISGTIKARSIGEIIFDDPGIDPDQTEIITKVGELQRAV